MKILYVSRDDFFRSPGGDTVQALKTKEYLEKAHPELEIDVVTFGDVGEYSSYQIIHVFNLMLPYEALCFLSRSRFSPTARFVLSTIYVDYSEFDMKNRVPSLLAPLLRLGEKHTVELVKNYAKYALGMKKIPGFYVLRGFSSSVRSLLGRMHMLLPNSQSELERVAADFGPLAAPARVVYNSVDHSTFPATEAAAFPTTKEGVVVAGRIEMRKNQLAVIRAANRLRLPCKIVGSPALNQKGYYEACLREAGPTVQFVGQVPQSELAQIFLASRVSVLASWFETTGLVSLEAARLGCNLVLTRRGDTYEYFGDEPFYCDPEMQPSIEEALDRAYRAEFRCHSLMERIDKVYCWERTAEATYRGYLEALVG